MNEESDLQRLKAAFQIKCKKCGSENISFYVDGGQTYSEHSSDPSRVSIGCNDCKKNDLIFYG